MGPGAESSLDLMGRTLDRLYLMLTLMAHTTRRETMSEDFIALLGGYLRNDLDTLERVLSFLGEMKPVNAGKEQKEI